LPATAPVLPLFGGRLHVSVLEGLGNRHNSNQEKETIVQPKPNQNRKTIYYNIILKTPLGRKNRFSIKINFNKKWLRDEIGSRNIKNTDKIHFFGGVGRRCRFC
jgi:hypothetical protein